MSKSKKIRRFLMTVTTGYLFFSYTGKPVFAEGIQQKQANLHKQQSIVHDSITTKKKELSQYESEEADMKEDVVKIDQQVKDTNLKIKKANAKIASIQDQVEALKLKIAETKDRIQKRENMLKSRAVAFYENKSEVNEYLDVILNAKSFSDVVDRIIAIGTIVDADQTMIDEYKKDQNSLENSQKTVHEKLDEVQNELTKMNDLKIELAYQVDQKNAILQSIKEKREKATGDLEELSKESASLAKQEKEAEAEQQRQKLAAEAARKKAESKKTNVTPKNLSPVIHDGNTIEIAIHAGMGLVGSSPYHWGGGRNSTDIQNHSFDCSSFVRWAYSMAGVNLGPITSTTTNTLVNRGYAVNESELKRGDILFFDTYKTNGHVGIYLGNRKFLDDNSSKGVSIDSMDDAYWEETFNGVARRVVE
jgi:peptidoglycan hydrolase CwlO-like protein